VTNPSTSSKPLPKRAVAHLAVLLLVEQALPPSLASKASPLAILVVLELPQALAISTSFATTPNSNSFAKSSKPSHAC
jgi:hypothetical protein